MGGMFYMLRVGL